MGEGRYVISQVVEKTGIKSHTIRYWEDELQLTIDRNNMGHRCYSDENIKLFFKVKQLKDLGYQLKAIKMLLDEIGTVDELDSESMLELKDEMNMRAMQQLEKSEITTYQVTNGGNTVTSLDSTPTSGKKNGSELIPGQATLEKINKFQDIMKRIILDAVRENNAEVTNTITESVTDNVIKEMDYLFRVKEDREEERFKKLDETIRGVQKSRQEVAATTGGKKKKKRLFGK